MGTFAPNLAAGFRRHDAAFLAAEAAARKFEGLANNQSPGRVLAAFKRAARVKRWPRSIVVLIDQLFSMTQPQDWAPGATPIVWPRNETLADELDISVRQLQNLLRRAIELGLIAMKDSGNGHRGGRRGADGTILWAYGIDLRPLGTRIGEFVRAAEQGEAERRQRDEFRRRLTIARKGIAQAAQTALEVAASGPDWAHEADVARLAATHARMTSDLDGLRRAVETLEARREALIADLNAQLAERTLANQNAGVSGDISPTNETDCTDSTTTPDKQSSKEHLYWARREKGSDPGEAPWLDQETAVTRDLEKYGVDVEFIASVCREQVWELAYGTPSWDGLVAIAQREAARLDIPRPAWTEAVRVMGRDGAAAAIVAILHKSAQGLVERPGAYLRGMSSRAAKGQLSLGRTFHGIREGRQSGHAPARRAFTNPADIVRRTARAWRTEDARR